jgi:serine-type D-Ala-D-Ala carboxypeptidase
MSLPQQIDSIVNDAVARRVFPGAVVLIARGGRVAHFAACGATTYDHLTTQAVSRDTIYDVASLTKVFTATAALRLHDAGALDLHASVATYLPEFRAATITVWQLLTHTSGLDIRLSALRRAGRESLLSAVYAASPLHPPGSRVAYTNVNSLLLGDIVARLYGAPLDIALRELVIEPLQLRDTQFRPDPALLARIAPTEIDLEWRGGLIHGSVHDESTHTLGGVAGHAGLFSTAEDLYVFCQAWLSPDHGRSMTDAIRGTTRHRQLPSVNRPLLKKETLALATTNHTPHLNVACGLGWMLDRPNFMAGAPAGTFGHTGFTGPAIVVAPQQASIVVVLSNRVHPLRGQPNHHQVTAEIVRAALADEQEAGLGP